MIWGCWRPPDEKYRIENEKKKLIISKKEIKKHELAKTKVNGKA